jgi:hypothetical protein
MSAQSLREQARAECRKAFGEPHVLKVPGGEIDRWTLKRPGGSEMYVTLDAPELPDLVHLMISDPGADVVEPIASHVMRTIEEVRKTIKAIEAQWQRGPNGPKVESGQDGL